jgi:hypothetical protein
MIMKLVSVCVARPGLANSSLQIHPGQELDPMPSRTRIQLAHRCPRLRESLQMWPRLGANSRVFKSPASDWWIQSQQSRLARTGQ